MAGMSEECKAAVTADFQAQDLDGNGYISMDELCKHMKEAGFGLTEDKVKAHFNRADLDDDGKVCLREFLAMVERAFMRLDMTVLRRDFDSYDMDQDGFISKSDLDKHFKLVEGVSKSSQALDELVRRGDENGDLKTSFAEYVYMVTRQVGERRAAEEAASRSQAHPNPDLDVEYLTSFFNGMDLDNDGYVTEDELKAEMLTKGFVMSDEQLKDYIDLFDLDADGKITLKEYIAMMDRAMIGLDMAVMKEDFDWYDMDRDGVLSKDDLDCYFTYVEGKPKKPEELDWMMKRSDTNGDGKVTFEEYVYFVTNKARR